MDKAIVVNRLEKKFEVNEKKPGFLGGISSIISPKKKVIKALKGISFSVKKGELVGFIGPNGAGKTTTLKILSGLLYPTSGFVEVLDYDPWERKDEFLKKISLVMGQKNQLWWDLPAIETFELNRAIYEIPKNKYNNNLEELVNLLKVEKILNIQVRRLSLGQRMKMELIAALLHQPEILFLDEPTIGLDIMSQQALRDFIYEYNKKNGATILLTSHNMDDLLNLAERILVINEGLIVFDGGFGELIDLYAKNKLIKITLSQETDIKRLESIGKIIKLSYPQVTLSVPRASSAVAAAEVLQNFPIADLTIEEVPIEEVVKKVFKLKTRI
jgi:ABC-2 type transport system ATP-binding protein